MSCTTVPRSAGQMVAQLAANRRCYLRADVVRRRSVHPPLSTWHILRSKLICGPGPAAELQFLVSRLDHSGLYGPDRLARGAPLKTVFYGFIKVIVSSTDLTQLILQISGIQSNSLGLQLCSQDVSLYQYAYNERRVDHVIRYSNSNSITASDWRR